MMICAIHGRYNIQGIYWIFGRCIRQMKGKTSKWTQYTKEIQDVWVIKVYKIDCTDRKHVKHAINRRWKVYVRARAYIG